MFPWTVWREGSGGLALPVLCSPAPATRPLWAESGRGHLASTWSGVAGAGAQALGRESDAAGRAVQGRQPSFR